MTAVVPARTDRCRSSEPASLFAGAAWQLRAAGWEHVFPLPRACKAPPPVTPSGADIAEWAEIVPRGNVAVGMPRDVTADGARWDVVALDVDDYRKGDVVKRGLTTVARIEAETGATFPATVKITSRGNDGSGKYLYRVPAGAELLGALPAVELVQWFHRYAVVPPSINADSGSSRFEWRSDARPATGWPGAPMARIPAPAEAAELPGGLVTALTRAGARGTPIDVTREQWRAFFDAMPVGIEGIPCTAVRRRFRAAVAAARGRTGVSRHEETLRHALSLLRYGEQGHLGANLALRRLAQVYATSVTDRTAEPAAHREFLRMIGRRAVGLVLADPTDSDDRVCCGCAEGMATLLINSGDPVEYADGIGVHIPSLLGRIDHPRVRAVVAAHLEAAR